LDDKPIMAIDVRQNFALDTHGPWFDKPVLSPSGALRINSVEGFTMSGCSYKSAHPDPVEG
jgi:hypothetical protein